MKVHRPRRLAVVTLGIALVISALGATPAAAAERDRTVITFDEAKTSIAFGEQWSLDIEVSNQRCRIRDCTDALTVTVTGDNGVKRTNVSDLYAFDTGNSPASGGVGNFRFGDPLPAGTYKIAATVKHFVPRDQALSVVSTPATLVVAPAAVSVDLRVESDATQPTGAVVSARLDGPYIEAYNRCLGYDNCYPPLPSGRWDLVVSDAEGNSIVEKSISVKSAEAQFVSFYWHDVPAESDYTTTGTFTASKADRNNFEIQNASDVSFTSPDAVEAESPTTPVVVPEDEGEIATPGSTVPVWLAASWILVLALLIAACVIFGALVRRQSVRAKAAPVSEPVAATQGELE